MFRRLHHMAKKTKLGGFLPVLLLCFVLVFTPHIAFAGVGSVVEKFLFEFVTGFFGWLAGMAGTMLDWSIKNVVIGFGEIYRTKGMGVAIDNLWQMLRDFFNLTFIFGLVMIGLRMIFDSSNSNTRKMLISLILAALFVNFSLLITKLVVDFSNVAAVQLVNSFDGGEISVAFNNIIGVTGLYNVKYLTYMEGSTGLVYIMGIMMILLVLTFVYIAGAILLMIRFAALNLYMLLSPLMFIGMVFPGAMGVTRQYWSGFLSKAFFAPAYILMLYFSYKIMQGFKFEGAENMSSVFVQSSKVNIEALLPPFTITAIFLIASVVIAQKMGMQGANGVISTGKMLTGKAKKYAGSASFGLAARAGRQTIGQGADILSRSQTLKNFAAKSKYGQTLMGATKKVADSSFDARKVAGMGKTFGIGEGRKGGYTTIAKEKTKRDTDFAESLGEVKTKDENGNLLPSVTEKAGELRDTAPHQAENAKVADLQRKADEAKAKLEAEEAKKAKLEAEVAELKAASDANPNSEGAHEAFKAKEAELEDFNANHAANIKKMQEVVDTTAKTADVAEKAFVQKLENEAESAIRFQNQLAFIQRRKDEAAWRNKLGSQVMGIVGGGSAGGVASGAATLGAFTGMAVTGGAAILGGAVVMGGADTRNQSVSALEKTYGRNGQNMAQKQKRKKRYEEEREFDKDYEDKDKKPKNDKEGKPDETQA